MEQSVSLETVYMAICQVQAFLRPYLGLANTHGAEFLSEDHWSRYVSPAVRAKLMDLSNEDLVNLSSLRLPAISEEMNSTSSAGAVEDPNRTATVDSKRKVENLGEFISQAQNCHLEKLGVITPLDCIVPNQLLSESPLPVISEAMCEKKIHEVGIMVDMVSALYRTTNSDLIVDVGSGKGYFASEMSLKHKIPVIGFDSRDTNTHGASQRDKKLTKKWAGLERRKRLKQLSESSNLHSDCMQNAANDKMRPTDPNQRGVLQKRSTVPTSTSTAVSNLVNSDSKFITTDSSTKASNKTQTMQAADTRCNDNRLQPLGSKTSDCKLYNPITLFVHPGMDLCKVIQEEIPLYKTIDSPRLLLSGLHTCGSLAVTTLNLFLQDPNTVALCCVGCCYQLMEEQKPDNHEDDEHQEQHFPISTYGKSLGLQLGRNARNLASQSVHRISASGQLQGSEFFWRALLNILLIELGISIPERIVGMRGLNKRSRTFHDYAAAALKKLGLADKMPEVHILESLEARHKEACARMSAFFQLKLVLAPVIEALILLDRLAFLWEQESVSNAHLVQLFDPVLSPRCFALIAWRNTYGKKSPETL